MKNAYKKKISLLIILKKGYIIYYIKFKTSNLIISNNSSHSNELVGRTNAVYMFKCHFGRNAFNENNTYVGLTSTTLARRFTMHLNDSSSLALHHKSPSYQIQISIKSSLKHSYNSI